MKLPFFQMYPSDYMRDTRVLSLAARGGWVDVLCMLHGASTRGTMTLPLIGWARVMSVSVDQAESVVTELDGMRVADVKRHDNGDVTLSSRRMLREYITREQTRLRVQRYREKETGNATETPQKTETKNSEAQKTECNPAPSAPAIVVPVSHIVAEYHDTCKSLPRVTVITDQRTKAIKARWRDAGEKPMEWFRVLFGKAEASDFLSGRNGKWTNANFDWLMNASNSLKVIEGNYDNRGGNSGNGRALFA